MLNSNHPYCDTPYRPMGVVFVTGKHNMDYAVCKAR